MAILLQAASRPAVTKRSRSVLSDDFEDSDDAPDGGIASNQISLSEEFIEGS